MSIDAKRRYAAAAFITLLLLSVFWPSPVVSSNRLWLNASLAIDELSFLGREAPSWDVVFWCLAGLLALVIIHTGHFTFRDLKTPWNQLRAMRPKWTATLGLAIASSVAAVALTWIVLDSPVMAWCEQIQSDAVEVAIRFLNRFGGGMNPPLIVVFFLLAGIAYRQPRWVSHAVAMGVAGLGAGLVAHGFKLMVGRTRPELWLGPFYFARGAANSFPSGHTVGAFALAGVLMFASPNRTLRVVAFILASAVGLSRVLAFRHWPSDVLASALIGLLAAWICTEAVTRVTGQAPTPRPE